MTKLKNLLLIYYLHFLFKAAFACAIFGDQNLATNPSVKLTKGNKDCYLVLCSKTTIKPDPSGRTIPHPCPAVGPYKIYNQVKNGKVYQDLFFQLGAENNRFAMHGYFGLPRKTHLTTKPDLSLLQKPMIEKGFLPEEIVKTPFGARKIKSLKSGDRVTSWDFDKKKWSEALVIEVKVVLKQVNLIKLKLDNKFIQVEPDQKFYNLGAKKWSTAKDLKVGDSLALGIDGEKLTGFPVQEVSIFPKKLDQKTVSLSLEQHHNFVLESGIIVHNKKLWDEKKGGFVEQKTSSTTRGIDRSNSFLPSISEGPSPHEIILNALFEFQHYPQMLENLRQEETLEKEAQEEHRVLQKFRQEQESFLAAKIKLAQLAAPECNRRARLFQEFQAVVSHEESTKPMEAKNLDAQESFSLLQQAFVHNPINPGSLKTLESDLFMELHNSLDNAILPESVQSSQKGFPIDVFGSAVALSLSVILGLGSIGPMLSVINYCQSISVKLLFHRVVFAQLLFFPWPVAYKVDGLFPDQSAVVLQSFGKGFGLKSLLDTLKIASSRMTSAPALNNLAKESIKVATTTSLMSIICPYIIPVALTAMIVKAAVSACQTETGRAAIESTKSLIAHLGDRLVETVVNVAQYFGVGPAVAGFVQTDVEKTKEVEKTECAKVMPPVFQKMTPEEKQVLINECCSSDLQAWKRTLAKLIASNRGLLADKLKSLITTSENSINKYMTLEAFAKISEYGRALFASSKPTDFFYPFVKKGPGRIHIATEKIIYNIENSLITTGDYFYFDLSHDSDHIEVFSIDKSRLETYPSKIIVAKTVLDLEGKEIPYKANFALGRVQINGEWKMDEENLRSLDRYLK